MTVGDLIRMALKECGVLGVGQTASAEDSNDALIKLNWMLGQWNRRRWLVYRTLDASCVSTGAVSYSVGIGGDINTPRPDRLEGGFLRQLVNGGNPTNPVDYPISLIDAREDYNRIAIKTLTPFPQYYFYDPTFPLGTLYPWPVAQASIYELHISLKSELTTFASLVEEIEMPPEYFETMLYNLAVRLAPSYGMEAPPTVKGMAIASLATLRGANMQIKRAQLPSAVLPRGSSYNVFSDQM